MALSAGTEWAPIPSAVRQRVWDRDGGSCRNCGATRDLHFDHIVPRSWGGSNGFENIQLLCRACNLRKGASLYDDLTDRALFAEVRTLPHANAVSGEGER